MTQDEILRMFREQAEEVQAALPTLNAIMMELADLLASSRGRLSKENFGVLVRLGGVLYKNGLSQFQARSDVAAIMKHSVENRQRTK
ncbi:hypothetical protein ACIPEN_09650 [Herbaspirillum chlorophenolicum]|uniref:Uncharacterized protein n=1 Tax=Herbaspirillum chlorophenolicum TaxID=211589 RepID=A0ABW8EXC5_9BURK